MNESVDHAESRIPPPVLTLAHFLAVVLLQVLFPLPLPLPGFLKIIGGLLALAALGLAFLAVRRLGLAHTSVEPHGSVTLVVTDGPYRFSRNPIYLGLVCLLIGIPLALNSYWGLLLSPLLVALLGRLVISYEEAYLERKFGLAYADYRSRVRRWL
jgi:protein-S-isoprenylcysteine O-methyltransferase Ste14